MGQWSNYAILLLQGRAIVQIGVEGLIFEAGPFLMFGEAVLKRKSVCFFKENNDGLWLVVKPRTLVSFY